MFYLSFRLVLIIAVAAISSINNWATSAHADVAPPPGMKSIPVCHQIETNTFSDLVIVGDLGPTPVERDWSGYDLVQIDALACLPTRYRADFNLFAISANEWKKTAVLKDGKLRAEARKPAFGPVKGIATDGYGLGALQVHSKDTLKSRILVWGIAGLREKNPVLFVKQVRDLHDGEVAERITILDPPAEFKK